MKGGALVEAGAPPSRLRARGHADCEQVFGEYFHYFPYFGMRGEENRENLDLSFFETVELYEEEFDESMLRNHEVATDCWHDCQGRCWNECSNS